MTKSDKKAVGKGAAYIYIESIISAITGYGLWLLLTKITTSGVIGTTSTVITLASIFTTIVTIGIPNSIPRFLGKTFSEEKLETTKVLVKASIFLVSVGIIAGAIVILVIRSYWILGPLNFTMITLTILLMGSSAVALLLRYIIIASLKTRSLVTRELIYSTVRVVLSALLILMGYGAIGLTLGYTIGQILVTVVLGLILLSLLKPSKIEKPEINFIPACKRLLFAGIAALTRKGTSLADLANYTGAIKYFDKVLAIGPNDKYALNDKDGCFYLPINMSSFFCAII
jgi:O-antigen/teichoic acid export membrane protein